MVANVAVTAEDVAFSRLIAYAAYQWPSYQTAAHHRLIARKLEAVERGEVKRLMIFMPPRHGKSMLASEFFPAWYMGRNPDHYVVAATYGQDLADDFGRKVKNQIADPGFQKIFPGVSLKDDSKSARRFHVHGADSAVEHQVTQGGAYFAVGVGGPLTGRGAHLLLIDDPIKDRQDADSEVTRRRIKDWYTSTAYTRLMPGGRVVVIQCMVGETPVLMADGAHKYLRDVSVGDMVATYEDGGVTSAKVLNWASQGIDSVFEIRTKSGTIVKANARHPFLVKRDGVNQWIRVKSLKVGDAILRVTGVNGEALHVPQRDVTCLQSAKAFASPTTTSTSGLVEADRLQPEKSPGLLQRSSTATASLLSNTTHLVLHKVDAAQFADSRQERMCGRIGAESCASTTTIQQAKSEHCCAMTATSPLDMASLQKSLSAPLNTCGITLDEIESIIAAGEQEVFDIQVAGTENFIANGLVSHNTRWHEDDLSGWLLNEHKAEGWDVLSLPALDGESPLWPEQYDKERLLKIKSAVGPRDWSALYQQSPSPDEGTYFLREWFKTWHARPAHLNIYGTSDYAVTDSGGDYTVHRIWGVAENGDIYRLDGWRGQSTADVWIDKKLDLVKRYQPLAWFGEAGVIQKAIEPMLIRRMRERNIYVRNEWMSSIADKPTRARGFQARAASGGVYFEAGADIDEFLKFPAGAHDDDVDTASLIGRAIDMAHPAIVPVTYNRPEYEDRWFRAFHKEDENADNDWMTA